MAPGDEQPGPFQLWDALAGRLGNKFMYPTWNLFEYVDHLRTRKTLLVPFRAQIPQNYGGSFAATSQHS